MSSPATSFMFADWQRDLHEAKELVRKTEKEVEALKARIGELEELEKPSESETKEKEFKYELTTIMYKDLIAQRDMITEIRRSINQQFAAEPSSTETSGVAAGNFQDTTHGNGRTSEVNNNSNNSGSATPPIPAVAAHTPAPLPVVAKYDKKRCRRDFYNTGPFKHLRDEKMHRITKGKSRRRCIVCCATCLPRNMDKKGADKDKGKENHYRAGYYTLYGCNSCVVRAKEEVTGYLVEKEDADLIPLCDKPRFPGDPRSCFEIHHSSLLYPELHCKKVLP